eukprot:COSAG01_NODE_3221_length_6395_cov_15.338945_4_plen_187_part_00
MSNDANPGQLSQLVLPLYGTEAGGRTSAELNQATDDASQYHLHAATSMLIRLSGLPEIYLRFVRDVRDCIATKPSITSTSRYKSVLRQGVQHAKWSNCTFLILTPRACVHRQVRHGVHRGGTAGRGDCRSGPGSHARVPPRNTSAATGNPALAEIIEAPWLVNGGHGASLRHHNRHWLRFAYDFES